MPILPGTAIEIEWKIPLAKERYMEVKNFKDLFGREIKIGDNVLNVWANTEGYKYERGHGAQGLVQWRIGKIIRFSAKGVRMEFYKDCKMKSVTIFNTRNRLIVMSKDGQVSTDIDTDRRLKEKDNKITSLEKKVLTTSQALNKSTIKVGRQGNEIGELKKELAEHEEHFKRFNLLDL